MRLEFGLCVEFARADLAQVVVYCVGMVVVVVVVVGDGLGKSRV